MAFTNIKPSHFLYGIANGINGKMYIGQTKYINKRKAVHYRGEGSLLVNNAINKYGNENLHHGTITECYCEEEVQVLEMFAIKHLHSKAPNGYNLTDGGEGNSGYEVSDETRSKLVESHKGYIHSDEAKMKVSESLLGNKRAVGNTNRLGATHTPEARLKMSESKKGNRLSEEHKRNIGLGYKGKKQPLITCPHCEKEGGIGAMKRYHLDKCKQRVVK